MMNTILWILGIFFLFCLAVYLVRPALVALIFLTVVGSIFGFWPGVVAATIGFFWMLIHFQQEED